MVFIAKRKAALLSDGREQTEDYQLKRQALSDAEEKLCEVNHLLSEVAANDPELLEEIRLEAKVAEVAATRWTDNVFNLLSFIKKNNAGYSEAQLREGLGVPVDFDYLS